MAGRVKAQLVTQEDMDEALDNRTSWTAEQLMETDFPATRWAVPDLIPVGLTVLAGAPKVGKSWLSLDLALQVATGGMFLDSIRVRQGSVLLLALEDSNRRLKSRIKQLQNGSRADLGALSVETVWEAGTKGLKLLDKKLHRMDQPRLVVIDVYARMRDAGIASPRSIYQADYEATAAFKSLADDHEVAVLLLHHTSKAQRADYFESVSGSTGITAAADVVSVLRRRRGAMDGQLLADGRDITATDLPLSRQASGRWSLSTVPRRNGESDTAANVLTIVSAAGPAGVRPTEVAEALAVSPNTARQRLWQLAQRGRLQGDGKGRYFCAAK
jgi:RecA-family ATPase